MIYQFSQAYQQISKNQNDRIFLKTGKKYLIWFCDRDVGHGTFEFTRNERLKLTCFGKLSHSIADLCKRGFCKKSVPMNACMVYIYLACNHKWRRLRYHRLHSVQHPRILSPQSECKWSKLKKNIIKVNSFKLLSDKKIHYIFSIFKKVQPLYSVTLPNTVEFTVLIPMKIINANTVYFQIRVQ